jgi:predicted lysophospholipase L1 biosynthesis ABC-type transport system permease subunit
VRFVVTGFAVVPGVEGGDGVGEGGVTTFDGLRRLEPAATPSVAAVRGRDGASGVAERIRASMGIEVGLPTPPSTVLNLDRVRSTPYIVAGSLTALALLSLGHLLLSAARRRRRDMAVLRSLGAERRWITGLLHWQAVVLAVATVVVAGPLGVAAGRVVYLSFIDRVGASTDGSTPLLTLALLFVTVLLAVNVVASVPARAARREAPGQVLGRE